MFGIGEQPSTAVTTAEGPNGFVLTDVTWDNGNEGETYGEVWVFQDTGDGPVEIFRTWRQTMRITSLTTEIPLIAGSTIYVGFDCCSGTVTLRGYVY